VSAVGFTLVMASLLIVLVLDADTSAPPVRELRREVRPSRR
jgi:hypothetical protein